MSDQDRQQPTGAKPLADVAADEVEAILAAAQEAAEQLRAETLGELDRARAQAEKNAEAIGEQARLLGRDEIANAEARGVEIERAARREAEQIISDATAAADEALSDARALSYGLTRLGKLLEEQAATILRDVEAGHRRLLADLRLTARGGADGPSEPSGPSRSARRPRSRVDSISENPFADVDPPSWISPER